MSNTMQDRQRAMSYAKLRCKQSNDGGLPAILSECWVLENALVLVGHLHRGCLPHLRFACCCALLHVLGCTHAS